MDNRAKRKDIYERQLGKEGAEAVADARTFAASVPWLKGALVVFGLSFFVFTCRIVTRWTGEAASVAQEDLGPRALLGKYEWFKDAQAELSAKQASIGVLESRVGPFRSIGVENMDRFQLDRFSQSDAELSGLILSYNNLAAEYNAQHAKINWAFADLGNVPAGSNPLEREHARYVQE